jgi:hypothetical protein
MRNVGCIANSDVFIAGLLPESHYFIVVDPEFTVIYVIVVAG